MALPPRLLFFSLFLLSLRTGATQDCTLSETTVNGRPVCSGKQIFFDDFNTFDENTWKHEYLIPWEPIYEFNYFDNNRNVSYVDKSSGKLVIKPRVMSDDFVRNGHLEFDYCTGHLKEECSRTARFFHYLPPVQSARITTKDSFFFKYGHIEMKCKLPKGDWFIPELWLLPKDESYGKGLMSGRIVVAMARGNSRLEFEGNDIGNKMLQSGVIMSSGNNTRSRMSRSIGADFWHAHWRTYTLTWTPEGFSLKINGETVVPQLVPRSYRGSLAELVKFTASEAKIWNGGSKLAPFDKEFYISLGVSVGGMKDFPDDSVSRNYVKPWKNFKVKALADFWNARHSWEPTWADEDRAKLSCLRVKVTAL